MMRALPLYAAFWGPTPSVVTDYTTVLLVDDATGAPFSTGVKLNDNAVGTPDVAEFPIGAALDTGAWRSVAGLGDVVQVTSSAGLLQVRGGPGGVPSLPRIPAGTTQDFTTTYKLADGKTGTLVVRLRGSAANAAVTLTRPAWSRLRLTVPNSFQAQTPYTTLGIAAVNADGWVSENRTKYTSAFEGALDGSNLPVASFGEFDDQVALVEAAIGGTASFDLHGAVWYSDMTSEMLARLASNPESAFPILTSVLSQAFAHRNFANLDINETALTANVNATEQAWAFRRGPVNTIPGDARTPSGGNGSPWFEAVALACDANPAYWSHGENYWWLKAVEWANANGKRVTLQDFSLVAGRNWGTGATPPAGWVNGDATGNMPKRRRYLDSINYAAVHGYRIDGIDLQGHLRTTRPIDMNDLSAFIRSVETLGLDIRMTELDVQPVNTPIGAAGYGDAASIVFAGQYTRHALDVMLANSTSLTTVGFWTNWTPTGNASEPGPRIAGFDAAGPTAVGNGVATALNKATDPALKTPHDPFWRYMLARYVAGDLWRAATNGANPGWTQTTSGNANGTSPAAGSGGADIPWVNAPAPTPGAPVAAVLWSGASYADFPEYGAFKVQWVDVAGDYIVAQMRSATGEIFRVSKTGANVTITGNAGAVTVGAVVAVGDNAIVINPAAVSASLNGGAVVATTAVSDARTVLRLGGDGTATATAKFTLLDRWGVAMSDASLIANSTVEGSVYATVAQVQADTATIYAPPAVIAANAPPSVTPPTFTFSVPAS